MAISKQRLEELIEQGATIWNEYVNEIRLQNNEFRDSDGYYGEKSYIKDNNLIRESWGDEDINLMYLLDQLFETKEEAEWHKEFGCIERTERLELPTWEEFLEIEKLHSFKSKEGKLIVYFRDNNTIFIEDEDWNILRGPLTKENYTLACRKAKELFLGGNK